MSILGETVGSSMTTIEGGRFPLRSVVAPIRFTVKGIHFDHPAGAALLILRSTGAEISENKITDVVPIPFIDDLTVAKGIWFLGLGGDESNLSGTFLISHNLIDNVADAPVSEGIFFSSFAGNVTIADNEISRASINGITIQLSSQSITVQILRNTIMPGPGRFPDFEGNVGDGMDVLAVPAAAVQISENEIVCDNPRADGIAVWGGVSGAVVTRNHVIMHGSNFGGVSLVSALGGSVSNSYIGQNRIQGTGGFALNIRSIEDLSLATQNTFVGNNIALFSSTVADVFLMKLRLKPTSESRIGLKHFT